MKSIWITWEVQRRNRELSTAFGAELIEMSELQRLPKWMKYIFGLFETISLLIRKRPGTVFCQNPSIVLSFLMVVVGLVTKIKVIVDAHYDGVVKTNRILSRILRFIHRHADYTIVTNSNHANVIRSRGGSPLILQDKLPTFEDRFRFTPPKPNTVLVITTFSPDEPISEIFEAARMLDFRGTKFLFTGKHLGKVDYSKVPDNVQLLGYVPEEEFIRNIFRASVVVDLTTNEDCLVCGAYEAISAGKPIILSDTLALRAYFGTGAAYCPNTASSIAATITYVIDNTIFFTERSVERRNILKHEWALSLDRAKIEIGIK